MNEVIDAVLAVDPLIRYVAIRRGGEVWMRQRADLSNPSASESDRYEELLVNPTLLTLATQRGNIDCGGLRFLVIRYGSFFQLLLPLRQGETEHVSIAFETHAEPTRYVGRIAEVLRRHALLTQGPLGPGSVAADA